MPFNPNNTNKEFRRCIFVFQYGSGFQRLFFKKYKTYGIFSFQSGGVVNGMAEFDMHLDEKVHYRDPKINFKNR